MTTSPTVESRYQRAMQTLQQRGQEHVLSWWHELDRSRREQLLAELEPIPWEALDSLIPTHVLGRPSRAVPEDLAPALVYPRVPAGDQEPLYTEARRLGRELIGAGKVAAFTVAGGQGTRLGYDCPKGMVPVTPAGSRTLFELFAKTIMAARQRYNVPVPWYIMTSPANHQETVKYLTDHDLFGLRPDDVVVFTQGLLPAFDLSGRLLLEAKHRLALAPDGHGGSLKALSSSGALKNMRSRGVEVISYFQVDNPLVKPFDPLFIGLHSMKGSEMSTKVTPKAGDLERVGNVCSSGGTAALASRNSTDVAGSAELKRLPGSSPPAISKAIVVEYSDFPESLAHARNEDGSRKFDAANLAVHLLEVAFVERITSRTLTLPFRRAEKVVAHVDDKGVVQRPARPNAVKLEMFIFDVMPLASNTLVLEVDRQEEFSPVKNATGADTLKTAKRDQVCRACRWLEGAGVAVPRRPGGEPDITIAISPTFALDSEDLASKVDQLPALHAGDVLYIE